MNLKFKMTDASSYQIAILPASKDSVIAVIETVAMPACDSRMSFYTRDWKRINNHLFIAPSLRDWMTDEGKGRAAEVEALVPFLVVGYDYDPTTRQLRLTNNLDDFLSPDDVAQAHTYFHDELLYHWNGKRMERVK